MDKNRHIKYLNVKATPSNASWRAAHFFTWTISDTSKINYTSSDSKFSGVSSGKVTLTLTNKLTGFSKSFTIACGNIREGQYMILNKGSGNYMDVEGPSKLSGAYIQQWEYHTGNQAKWNIILMSNGDYVIQSVYSQKYLRVVDGSSSGGAAIIQFENCNWTSTRWKIEETSSGGYKIVPMLVSNFAIMVPSNSNDNGTNLVQNAYTNDTNYYDEWIFDNIGETPGINNGDVYTIKASHSSKAITAENGSTNNGTNISQYTLTPGYQWQRWKFLYLGNGEYKIQDMNSGKLLSISASSSSNRANAQLWYDDGTTGQIFKIKENKDGTYTFLSKCSYYIYALTVADSNMSNNSNIYQYSNTGSNNQKFVVAEHNITMDYISPCIKDLYLYATGFAPNTSKSYRQQLVLQYIRHNHNSYTGNLWKIVADDINLDFIEYVNSRDPFLNKIFNGAVGQIPEQPGKSAASYIMDYNGEYIDFYHMCATINAMIYQDYSGLIILDNYAKNLAGWAADLITTVPDALNRLDDLNLQANYTNVYDSMYYILSSGGESSHYPREDYLADIDAILIYTSNKNIIMESFEQQFEYYYKYNCRDRFALIESAITYEESLEIVDEYLNLTPVVTALLDGTPLTILLPSQKNAIRDAFVNYFWECVENE